MKNILAILIFTIFVFGCNEDEGKLFSSVTLKSPLETTVDYCDVTFEWKGRRIDGKFVIDVSTDENFDNIIFTDSTTAEDYTLSGSLQPNTQFFWRVTADMEIEMGSFMTTAEPKLTDFEGIFLVEAELFDPGDTLPDGRWNDTLKIKLINEIPMLTNLNDSIIIQLSPNTFESSSCEILIYQENYLFRSRRRAYFNTKTGFFMFSDATDYNHFTTYIKYRGNIND